MFWNGGRFLLIFVLFLLLGGLVGLALYMIYQAFENNLLHHEITLLGDRDQLSLFFISDTHLRKIDEQMIQRVNKEIDAVIIGGDFADKRTPIPRIYENIRLLKTLGPVYFVWGNNDREVGEDYLRNIFKETGVTIIENNAILLPNSQNKCWLSAIDYTPTKNGRFSKAFAKCDEDDTVIFISHNPQVFQKVSKEYKVDFMMGGHLHGGQIRLGPFGIHPHGSFSKINGVPALISNGYGTTMISMRLNAKPQCHIIDVNFRKEIESPH